jgi:excisionase family DNA binding protein
MRRADNGSAQEVKPDALLTVPEVADLLRLSVKAVYSLVETRRIPHVRVSNRLRFHRQEIYAWLDGNRVPAEE